MPSNLIDHSHCIFCNKWQNPNQPKFKIFGYKLTNNFRAIVCPQCLETKTLKQLQTAITNNALKVIKK